MEIYRADGWQGAIAAAEPGKITSLAKNLLTYNNFYEAECAFPPTENGLSSVPTAPATPNCL